MSDQNMDVTTEHLALANICINLACAVSNWPEEIEGQMRDLQRRFSLIQATMMERHRVLIEKQEQERAAAAAAAVEPKPEPSDFDLDSAIKEAENEINQLSKSFGSRGRNEGVYSNE